MIYKGFLLITLVLSTTVLSNGQSPALLDVGGYKLDVVRQGSGEPAVILVAGLGDDLSEWK